MCERAEKEPILKFWFRQYLEDPFKVLSFCAFVGLGVVYHQAQQKQDSNFILLQQQNEAALKRMERRNDVLVARIEAETRAMTNVTNRLDRIDAELLRLEHNIDKQK